MLPLYTANVFINALAELMAVRLHWQLGECGQEEIHSDMTFPLNWSRLFLPFQPLPTPSPSAAAAAAAAAAVWPRPATSLSLWIIPLLESC